ncbi:hypothetical protein ZIOFF_048557 [Zingiber officinale]|uniref:HAT C-terminal dimerisation domain-containing protein n=1 Tax=Zingiber officinale TaxID=94328 RepID=A0A8J5KUD6_ZINOF|nr:hypothetical protein ZIOFF_048557 [Zingiber officinale]
MPVEKIVVLAEEERQVDEIALAEVQVKVVLLPDADEMAKQLNESHGDRCSGGRDETLPTAETTANSSKLQAFYAGNTNGYNGSEYVHGGDCKTSRITLSDTQRGLDRYLKETSSGHPARSDLDMYLEEAVRPSKGSEDNFDILAWWKYNAAKYPVLSMIGRDIMGIPISVVPLDSEARTLNQY